MRVDERAGGTEEDYESGRTRGHAVAFRSRLNRAMKTCDAAAAAAAVGWTRILSLFGGVIFRANPAPPQPPPPPRHFPTTAPPPERPARVETVEDGVFYRTRAGRNAYKIRPLRRSGTRLRIVSLDFFLMCPESAGPVGCYPVESRVKSRAGRSDWTNFRSFYVVSPIPSRWSDTPRNSRHQTAVAYLRLLFGDDDENNMCSLFHLNTCTYRHKYFIRTLIKNL